MQMETTSERQRRINRGFMWVVVGSIAVHVGAIGGVVLVQQMDGTSARPLTSIPVELVRLGKKRDPKLLPRREAPRAAPPVDDAVALDTKAEATPNPRKPEPAKSPTLSKAAERLLAGTADSELDRSMRNIDDVEGDPEGDPLGTASESTHPASGYALEVSRVLKSSYAVPDLIPSSQRRFLEAEVVLHVERDGTISSYEFIRRHPNTLFMSALEALLTRIKLPPPPAALADDMKKTGLGVVFKP